ncbi:MAG: DUF4331 domain-containing protein [Candidatus Eremiobacteraeota bacterium]|nr:DUF4331 domain-containing protein [Candidatus Eremiobacteraeota bacterium]
MIKRILLATAGVLTALAVIFAVGLYSLKQVPASDHQDSPLTVGRPGADITDVFVFPAANPNNVVLAMDIHPLVPAGMSDSAAFDPAVLYQFKIDTTGDYREDKVIQFRAVGVGVNQHLEVVGPTRPAMVGTQSTWLGGASTVSFGRTARLGDGASAFAGVRREPFYFDLAQFLKIIPDRDYKEHPNPPPPSASCFRKPGVNFFSNYNVLSLIAEVPRRMLSGPQGKLGIVHVYATTSLRENGSSQYTQVERLARPGIKEVFEAFANHDTTNRSAPWNDPMLARSIVNFMTAAKPNGAGRSMELTNAVEHTLIPDEMTANLGASGPAVYLAVETKGKSALPTAVVRVVPEAGLKGLKKSLANKTRDFGGRDPSSPVIDVSLGVVFGTLGQKVGLAQDDGKDTACLTSDNVDAGSRGVTAAFPYIGNPM